MTVKEKAKQLIEVFGNELAPKVVDEILCNCHDDMDEFYHDVKFVILSINSVRDMRDIRTMEKLIESNRKFDEKNNNSIKYNPDDRSEDNPNVTNLFI